MRPIAEGEQNDYTQTDEEDMGEWLGSVVCSGDKELHHNVVTLWYGVNKI